MTICKFPLAFIDRQEIEMRQDARLLSAQAQGGRLYLYALVYSGRGTGKRVFRLFATGQPLPDTDLDFVATVRRSGRVWHLFEEVA